MGNFNGTALNSPPQRKETNQPIMITHRRKKGQDPYQVMIQHFGDQCCNQTCGKQVKWCLSV